MDQLEGFASKGHERRVCWLKQSINELKQSHGQWYLQFHRVILQFGFTMIEEDHLVYLKQSNDRFLIMTQYVDGILMASNYLEMIATIKGWLTWNFDMKDMSNASYMLGVKIYLNRPQRVLSLSQETYMKNVFDKFKMHNMKPYRLQLKRTITLAFKIVWKLLKNSNRWRVYHTPTSSSAWCMCCCVLAPTYPSPLGY